MNASPLRGPLDGIVVADLSRVLAGPYCTMLLSDLGARVIKIEVPETGDDARHMGPFVDGESMYFLSANRGKESIALDLKSPNDRALFDSILAGADVLVENFRPGTLEKLGYPVSELNARFPNLIYAAISGFGHSGPDSRKPAYDLVVQGLGGIMSITGQEGGPPVRVGTSIGDIAAGLFGALAINAALLHRQKTGEARIVDVAMLDCQLALLENAIARYTSTGEIPKALGTRHPSITPFEAFKTSDGHIIVAAGNDALFSKLCTAIGRPSAPKDPRFNTNHARTHNAEGVRELVSSALREKPSSYWLKTINDAGVPCAPINNIAEAVAQPQVRARNMLVDIALPSGRNVSLAGNPMKISGFPDPTRREPAPALDQHRQKILTDFANRVR
jgi:CoA:oxalate CoA-transferase